MNISKLFFILFQRLGISRWPRTKRIVIGIAGVLSLLLLLIIFSNKQISKKSSLTKVSLVPKQAKPKKELNYEFVKFDTIQIPTFPRAEKPVVEMPEKMKQISLSEKSSSQPGTEIEKPKLKKSTKSKISRVSSMLPKQQPASSQTLGVNKNPNMIVMNNMAQNNVAGTGTPATVSGMQSTLVKVVLPNRTSVSNGSLVEARVLREAQWGNVFIPRRTKLIGIASLYNNRVHIDMREIILNNKSRSCSGRAYDIKRLLGLPYSPVNSEAKRVVMEEVRDAVVGVPVLGRMANRATYNRNFNQDVSSLDEGTEFYVLINSIY